MLHGPVQIAGVDDLVVSPNTWWSWAIACIAGTLLAASPPFMRSSAPPGIGSSLSGTSVIFVDDDNCPGPGSGTVGDPYCSIQTAIDNAVATDEIVVAPGTYLEAIDFLGKAVTLRSSDGPEVTIIDGTGNFHVVQCVTGEGLDTVLDGFTITGGNANGASPNNRGGGMYNDASSPTVTNCTFSGNTAGNTGGGMVNVASSPSVTNCTFSGNTAGGRGGGMDNFNGGSPTVTNCTFSGNSAPSGGGMRNFSSSSTVTNCTFSGNSAVSGGGMWNFSNSPTVTGCTFEGNTADNGGGMANGASSPTVTNCTFSGNTAGGSGGGMRNYIGSSPTVTNCTFSGNTAGTGGGMYNFSNSSPTVTGCIFEGNTVSAVGGGMINFCSRPTVINCTFNGNTAVDGGAILNFRSFPTMLNTVLWGNSPAEIFDDDNSASTVSYSDVQGGWPGLGFNNIDADPLFVDPANGDFRLSPGSPCIDAADNTAVPLEITTDLDGNPRFVDDPDTSDTGNGEPPVVDMGAYELQVRCPWDLSGNGNVGVDDLLLLLSNFGPCEDISACPADFGLDGFVSVPDLLALIANFGPCPGSDCPWDINGDGIVDQADVRLVLGNFGPCDGCPEDVNGDGIVNGLDVSAVATHFGPCP